MSGAGLMRGFFTRVVMYSEPLKLYSGSFIEPLDQCKRIVLIVPVWLYLVTHRASKQVVDVPGEEYDRV